MLANSIFCYKKNNNLSTSDDNNDNSNSNTKEIFNPDELKFIRSLALCNQTLPLLINSFCPSIFGHELVKMGILLGLFGNHYYIKWSAIIVVWINY